MSPLAKWTQLFLSEVFKNNQIILQLLEFHKNLIITGWNERNINAKEISSWVTIQINCTFIHPKFTKTLSFLATQCDRGDPPQTCWSRICSTRSPCDTLRREKYYSSSHLCSHWITKWFIFLKEVIACISPGTATVQSLSEGIEFIFYCDETDKAWWSLSSSRLILKVLFAAVSFEKKLLSLLAESPSLKKCTQARERKLFQRWLKCFHSLLNEKLHSISSLFYVLLFFLTWKKNVSILS